MFVLEGEGGGEGCWMHLWLDGMKIQIEDKNRFLENPWHSLWSSSEGQVSLGDQYPVCHWYTSTTTGNCRAIYSRATLSKAAAVSNVAMGITPAGLSVHTMKKKTNFVVVRGRKELKKATQQSTHSKLISHESNSTLATVLCEW